MIQGFEWYVKKDEQHWNRLSGQLEKLSNIGVDMIWIPPVTKAGAKSSTGYDVYDLWDLGEFNQRGHVATSYGTKDELVALSNNATALGIKLLGDAVLNQRTGADASMTCSAHKVDPANRLQSTSGTQDIKAWVSYQYPGRGTTYSDKSWGCDDFSAIDYDDITKESAIWKIDGENNEFATDVSDEHGNYDYLVLADVAFANPSVQEDIKKWGSWVTEQLGLGGFRLDAAKHISQAFLNDWISSVSSDKSDLLFVAEYLTGDPSVVQSFVDGFDSPVSVFDTPLQTNFNQFSTGEKTDMATVFDYTWLANKPEQAVTYVNNHDTQVGQALETLWVEGWFTPLAYALILLRDTDSYPSLFYGDMYGIYDDAGTFTAAPYGTQIGDLAFARKYFAYGTQTDYLNDASTIGWTRQGISDHPEGLAVVMTNAQDGDKTKRMNVGKQHAGETWSSLFGGGGEVTIGSDGFADFVAGARTVNMYTRADASQRSKFTSWSTSI
ncbi:hypothetical protein OHC33_006288 [Knufia fluminis]|uniref:Glycosyl hydrolase family 13 catalytic domain-containing protein n=1 Tax=Knufia fluminis TaxID=191047 RepID=A0AAN8ESL9_9EURO|nr:hypothetical protein OHC33_006288 [Knufia fluminis]